MADLLSLLSLGANALSAHRAASATASHNLENANTPGYSRQRANLAAVLPAYRLGGSFIGRGVGLESVSQARDFGAERQFTLASEAKSRSSAQADALEALSALDPQAAGAIGGSISDFYSAMRQLQQNPGDISLRQAAVGQARSVGLAFNRTALGLDGARDAVDAKLGAGLSEVNQLTQQMADLNSQVRQARASGAEPNDLLDARQKTQDRLVELLGVQPIPTKDGDVNLSLADGSSVVTGAVAAKLSTSVDAANNGHLAIVATRADGSGSSTVTTALGGQWGGMITARDGALKSAESALDTLATDWSAAVNTVHAAGFALDGSTGRALFTGTSAATLSINAAVLADPKLLAGAASAATVPGDGTNFQALIGTESTALSGGLDALDALASIVSGYGASAASARATADADGAVLDHATSLRESVSGVSVDEEMIELTKAQRGFEAAMKVITTANEMLDTLMSLKSP
ncbi:MAG: flagellar hook-associated protein FlgK [Archangiaceae bacterium]|nr:flagellar hook-associated protein FlgK [Archangiaceae bacterium]